MIFAPSNIKDFLYTPGKYFLIPEFQRPYSWQADNIQVLLDDLEQLAVQPNKKHYFGSVVSVNDTKDPNAKAIIDGQQRVTTTLLLMMAIYHIVDGDSSKSFIQADEIRDKYLYNSQSFIDEKNRIKLKAVTTDNTIFEKLYNRDELTTEEKRSKLYLAYEQFLQYFSERDELEKYINTLEKFDIVTIDLNTNDDDPQRVFESINSTGKPLSDGDKIRNFALMLKSSEDRQYVLDNYWRKIEAPLTTVDSDFITDFFRVFIITRRGTTIQTGKVYPEFKELFYNSVKNQTRDELDDFYGDMVKLLKYYLLLKFGTDDKSEYKYIADMLFRMRYLQIEAYLPFALSVLECIDSRKLTEEEGLEVFNLIETYFARRVICNISTTGSEKLFANLHRDILRNLEASENSNYVDIMKYLLLNRGGNLRLPRNAEIEFAIAKNQTYYQRKAHVNYLLASVDDQNKDSALLRQIESKERKLSIEHVMPQTLTKQWVSALGDDYERVHSSYLHCLGNLTLTGYNSTYSNLPYSGYEGKDKKTLVDKHGMGVGLDYSPLAINMQFRGTDVWDEEQILKRIEWWQKHLTVIWPEPTSSYKPVEVDSKVYLADEVDLTGALVRIVNIQEDSTPVTSWSEVIDMVVERIFELYPDIFDQVKEDEFLARYIRKDSESLIRAEQISDTEYFVECGTNTNYKRMIIQKLMKLANISRTEVSVELAEPLKV